MDGIDTKFYRLQTAQRRESGRAVGVHFKGQRADPFFDHRDQGSSPVNGQEPDGVFDHDAVGFQSLHHFPGFLRVKFIRVYRLKEYTRETTTSIPSALAIFTEFTRLFQSCRASKIIRRLRPLAAQR